MNEEQRELLSTRVNETLYYFWDPIGVNDAPEARDEYDSYVDKIVDLLLKNATEREVEKQLLHIETRSMELSAGSTSHRYEAAERLVHWRRWILDQ